MLGSEAAFPFWSSDQTKEEVPTSGLTKRQYFAGLCMQAVIGSYSPDGCFVATEAAKIAIEHADALLDALAQVRGATNEKGK